ncbi:extracellular solute-binding protein [Paenibacillus chungangensis]|uniref:Extracellular solute-binding protein n=1 Tax=Paenibacillus chungangensis TaxID=696535 RepID=A0ABW3HKJ2_9BACL
MKKTFTLLVAVILTLSVWLTGCSGGEKENPSSDNQLSSTPENVNESGFPVVKEPVKLKMMGAKFPLQGPWDQMMFFKEMEKMTGISFEFDTPDAKVYDEKKNLAFASNNLPDVFFGGNLSSFDQLNYGKQGLLIPLEGLIDKYAPNLASLMEKDPSIKKAITSPDGHIYALPQITDITRDLMTQKAYLNYSFMEALGNPEAPQTVDELFELLKRFRDEDPNKNGIKDEVPMSFDTLKNDALYNARVFLLPAFGENEDRFNNSAGSTTRLTVKDDTLYHTVLTDGYKEWVKFMKKANDEKLLDPEIFIQTTQQFKAKGADNRIGFSTMVAPFLVWKIEKPEDNAKYPLVLPLTSSISQEKVFAPKQSIIPGAFAITKHNKHPEATLRWVDYLYTPEGFILANQGVENEAWEWKDAEKTSWVRIVPEGVPMEEFRAKNTPDVGTILPMLKSRELNYKQDNLINSILNEHSEQLSEFSKVGMPLLFLTEEEESRANILKNDLNNYIAQMEAKFILGNESMDKWDDFTATLKKMNVDEFIGIYQTAYDRYTASK